MTWQEKVVQEAMTWLKTPYHSGARIKGVGVDCGQILIAVYEAAGVLQPGECNPGDYIPDRHLHRSEEKYLEWINRYCERVDGAPEPGDIAMFHFGRSNSHSAIVIKWPLVLHAYVRLGVILSNVNEALLNDDSGRSRLRGVYRPRR